MVQLAEKPSDGAADPALDRRFMRAAIGFGRRALGQTAPNPSVGALVVSGGVVVGRGLTRPGGRPHAETEALAQAGARARGATLYVSLEPCSHTGLTPPCAQAIIEAGIARVVSSLDDPDPRVAGRGHAMMRAAGIDVVTGVETAAARQAHLGHILRVTEGRPFVTLKLAETADGYAAGDIHDGRLMITGRAANNRVQTMRAAHDAIMVGIGTALADDPLLTVRLPGMEGRKPLRVLLDGSLAIPHNSRLLATCSSHPLLVLCAEGVSESARATVAAFGAEVVAVAAEAGRRISLAAALQALGARGVTRVFSEGGPKVGSGLIRAGLADEVVLFTSPKPIGREGVPVLTKEARRILLSNAGYDLVEDGQAGNDRMRIWRRRG
ncbi:MAG: bifunctional diaminohydroxyphosphoribosylaminopyrimidine deaminase/5-amino-6-(5-phosphoribosylamino)uracil reductase RibD [Beijerinckiaceae bacterium]